MLHVYLLQFLVNSLKDGLLLSEVVYLHPQLGVGGQRAVEPDWWLSPRATREKNTQRDSDIFMQQYSGKLLFAEKTDFHDLSVLVTEKRSMLYEKVPNVCGKLLKTTCKLRKWISCSTFSHCIYSICSRYVRNVKKAWCIKTWYIYTYLLQSVFHDPQLFLESPMLLLTPMDSEVGIYTTYIITVGTSLCIIYL